MNQERQRRILKRLVKHLEKQSGSSCMGGGRFMYESSHPSYGTFFEVTYDGKIRFYEVQSGTKTDRKNAK